MSQLAAVNGDQYVAMVPVSVPMATRHSHGNRVICTHGNPLYIANRNTYARPPVSV